MTEGVGDRSRPTGTGPSTQHLGLLLLVQNRRDFVDAGCPRYVGMVRVVEEGANFYMAAWTQAHQAKELFAVLPLGFPECLPKTSGK